jgi:hypothetical protein
MATVLMGGRCLGTMMIANASKYTPPQLANIVQRFRLAALLDDHHNKQRVFP